jgi:hypothetical protein
MHMTVRKQKLVTDTLLNIAEVLDAATWARVVNDILTYQATLVDKHGNICLNHALDEDNEDVFTTMQRGIAATPIIAGTKVLLSRGCGWFHLTSQDAVATRRKYLYGTVKGFMEANRHSDEDSIVTKLAIIQRECTFPSYIVVPVNDVTALVAESPDDKRKLSMLLYNHRTSEKAKQPFCIDITLKASSDREVINISDSAGNYCTDTDISIPLREAEKKQVELIIAVKGRGATKAPINLKQWLLGYGTLDDAIAAGRSKRYIDSAYNLTDIEIELTISGGELRQGAKSTHKMSTAAEGTRLMLKPVRVAGTYKVAVKLVEKQHQQLVVA